jgi:hypothetical protein
MTISLWEISQHAAGQRIDLFREQADVIAARKQTIEQPARLRIAALQNVIVDEPEAAGQERSFTCGQAVAGVFAFVAQNEFILDQKPILDRPKRSADPRVLGRKEAGGHRDQQQTGIEPLGAVGLHEAVEVAVETALTDLGMDFVGDLALPPDSLNAWVSSSFAARSNATQAITFE